MGRRYDASMVETGVRRLIYAIAASVLALHGPSSTTNAAAAADVGITACDRLASLPFDEARVAEPVRHVGDVDAAVAACQADLRNFPDHPRLLLQLGVLMDRQEQPRQTRAAALVVLQKAADRHYPAAQYYLAEAMLRRRDLGLRHRGIGLMLDAARAGHLEAQAQISYYVGDMDRATRREAIALGEKAIERGQLGAMAAVANAYIMVLSDQQNYARAVAYLRTADEKGNYDAMALLGRLQVFSAVPAALRDLIPENPYGGMDRLRRAADAGNRRAAFFIGMIYAGASDNMPADWSKMIKWFCRAGERGRYMVAEMLERDVDDYRCPEETDLR
jgi:TPR repeat protein